MFYKLKEEDISTVNGWVCLEKEFNTKLEKKKHIRELSRAATKLALDIEKNQEKLDPNAVASPYGEDMVYPILKLCKKSLNMALDYFLAEKGVAFFEGFLLENWLVARSFIPMTELGPKADELMEFLSQTINETGETEKTIYINYEEVCCETSYIVGVLLK